MNVKKSWHAQVLGLIVVIFGIIFLGNSVKWWNVNIFFDGWWTLFITIPAIFSIFRGKNITSSLLVFGVGMLFLLACQKLIVWGTIGNILIPILIIALGISIIFSTKLKVLNPRKKKNSSHDCNMIGALGQYEQKVTSKYYGGSCSTVFGKVTLDLTKAEIKEDISIAVLSLFGVIEIKTKEDVDVKASGTAIFGSTEDHVKHETTKKSPTIYIHYTCLFGDIEIL